MQSDTADLTPVPPAGKLDETYSLSLILTHWLHYVKAGHHPQNRKCVTYCIAIIVEPSHGHTPGNRQQVTCTENW